MNHSIAADLQVSDRSDSDGVVRFAVDIWSAADPSERITILEGSELSVPEEDVRGECSVTTGWYSSDVELLEDAGVMPLLLVGVGQPQTRMSLNDDSTESVDVWTNGTQWLSFFLPPADSRPVFESDTSPDGNVRHVAIAKRGT